MSNPSTLTTFQGPETWRNMSAHLTACLSFGESDGFVALENGHCRRYWGICKVSYHSEAPSWIGRKGYFSMDMEGVMCGRSICLFLRLQIRPFGTLWGSNITSWKRCRFSRFGSCQEWAFLSNKVIDYFAAKLQSVLYVSRECMVWCLGVTTQYLPLEDVFVWFGFPHRCMPVVFQVGYLQIVL